MKEKRSINEQEKLILNSKSDLLNISIDKINNINIENFSGIYFNKLYEEAVKSEALLETDECSPVRKPKITKKFSKKSKSNKTKLNKSIIKTKSIDKKRFSEENNYFITPKAEQYEDNQKNKDLNNNNNNKYKTNKKKKKNKKYSINRIIFSIKYDSFFGEEVAVLGSISKLGFWKLDEGLHLKWNEGNIWKGEINLNSKDIKTFEFKFVVFEKDKIKYWEEGENNIFNIDEIINNYIEKNKKGIYNKYRYEYDEKNKSLLIQRRWN